MNYTEERIKKIEDKVKRLEDFLNIQDKEIYEYSVECSEIYSYSN